MRLMYYVACVALGLCLVSCSGGNDKKRAETVARDCVKAMAADDRAVLQTLMTEQMYADYVSAVDLLRNQTALLSSFGQKVPNIGDIEFVSASCERIEGDKAYVNVETRVGEITQFETTVLKKEDGNWKIAGKQ